MHSKSKKSTRKGTNKSQRHKAFHERVVSLGCLVTGDTHQVTIHHIYGAKTELKTLNNGSEHVGEYAVIPLHPIVHMYQYGDIAQKNGLHNLEAHKKMFVDEYGTELDLLEKMREQYNERYPGCEYIDNDKIDLILKTG